LLAYFLLGDARRTAKENLTRTLPTLSKRDRGRLARGVYRVLGGHQHLLSLIETHGVDAIVISAREIDAGRLHTLESVCLAGRVRLALARVSIEELVGRSGQV